MARRDILTGQFWREFRRDLKRSKKDKRSRMGLLFRTALLTYFVGVAWFYGSQVYGLHDTETYVILGLMLAVVLVAIGGRAVSNWLDERRVFAEDLAATPPNIAERLQRLALGELAMTARALSELWLSTHVLPAGYEARTRKIQIDKLREANVWDEMPSDARRWMMCPDGEWAAERSVAVLSRAETLHTLLWALFMVPALRRLDELAAPLAFASIAKALRGRARGVRPTWDLRIARNEANEFFIRCYAERVHRGLQTADDENQRKAIEDWMDGIAEGAIADAFAGDLTIAELDEASLDQVGRSAALRMVTLDAVLGLMDGRDEWERLTVLVYGSMAGGGKAVEGSEALASS